MFNLFSTIYLELFTFISPIKCLQLCHLANSNLPLGNGRGRGDGAHTLLRVHHPGNDFLLFVRQPPRNRRRLREVSVSVASRGWGLRGERIHMSGTQTSSCW